LTVLLLAAEALWGQEGPSPEYRAASPAVAEIAQPALREVEALKGENVRLKLDSLDKQMRLMQEQYTRLQEAQRALVGELQTLDAEILKARGLPIEEHRVNWQTGKIEPATARTGVLAAPQEKKQ
jgi:dsDNA-specific endonuclease/ATPase MutS2